MAIITKILVDWSVLWILQREGGGISALSRMPPPSRLKCCAAFTIIIIKYLYGRMSIIYIHYIVFSSRFPPHMWENIFTYILIFVLYHDNIQEQYFYHVPFLCPLFAQGFLIRWLTDRIICAATSCNMYLLKLIIYHIKRIKSDFVFIYMSARCRLITN